MRLDKALWYLRLAASRTFAREWIEQGHIRLNARRIEKPGTAVKPGDVITLPMRTHVQVIEILALPHRRGPASEAQSCYRVLDAGGGTLLAAGETTTPEGTTKP